MNKTTIYYDFEATGVSKDADCISVGLLAVTEINKWKHDVDYDDVVGFTQYPYDKLCHKLSVNKNQFNTLQDKENYANKLISDNYRPCLEIKTFYAEFTDFSLNKCDAWVKENIVNKLQLMENIIINPNVVDYKKNNIEILGHQENISNHLKQWLSQFEDIEFWADFDVIDKPMLVDLIAEWNYSKNDFDIISAKNPTIIKRSKVGLPKHLPNIKYDQFFDLHTLFKIKGIDTDISREEFSEVRQQVIPLPFSDCDKSHNALFDSYVSWLCYNKLMKI